MVHDIAGLDDLLLHGFSEIGVSRSIGIPAQVAGISRAVAGNTDINRLRAVPVDSHADGKRPSLIGAEAILKDLLQLFLQIRFL